MITNHNKEVTKMIIDFMTAKGLTVNGICGLLGNLYVESGVQPRNLQNSYEKSLGMTDEQYIAKVDSGEYTNFVNDRAGFGLAQLTSSGRKQGFLDYVRSKGVSIGDTTAQIEYLYKELALAYKGVLNALTDKTKTIDDCAEIVMLKFERPKNQSRDNIDKRIGYAKDFYDTYFSNAPTKNLHVPIVAISAGHYKYTSGKRCLKSLDPNETREWVLNDRIADLVEKMLTEYEVSVVRLDDTTGEKLVSLQTRKMIAENAHADIYIAIHHNAGVKGGSGGGTVVYHYPTPNNKAQAEKLYKSIIDQTKLVGNRSQGVKDTTELYEVYAPTMDSYLIENGFMDSSTDVPIILKEEHAIKTATGVVNYLVNAYSIKLSSTVEKPLNDPSTENQKEDAPSKVESAESHNNDYRGRYVTTDTLNVRYGAGITKKKICALPEGTVVNCYGFYTRVLGVDWLYVQFNLNGTKITGFCSSKYLRKS